MINLELLEKALENHKFRVNIKGLVKMDFSIFYKAVYEKPWLKIVACPDHIIEYGFLKGFINESIQNLRNEFNVAPKEKYDADVYLRNSLEKRILKDPYFMLSDKNIADVQLKFQEGKIINVQVKTDAGTIVEFLEITCTNLEESKKVIDKHKL